MEKTPKSRAEIEQLVLRELRDYGGCEGAAGISVVGYGSVGDRSCDGDHNWTVDAFNCGTASDYECERALMSIVSRFQSFYELVQKH